MDIGVDDRPVRPEPFIGVGFHAFFPMHARQTTPEVERVLHERWRELNPSFARVTHQWDWNVEHAARQIAMMRETATQVYLTTWDPEDLASGAVREAYAGRVEKMLEDLVAARGLAHIRWYCMTNELSLPGTWAAMVKDLPKFEDYHRRIFSALRERNVDVRLLASDASPVANWGTIRWAAEHMDDVTGAYGGHHYMDEHTPEDAGFYGWFVEQVRGVAELAHRRGKPFLIGEFGARQYFGPPARQGFARLDSCDYFDTPREPMAALQTAEAVLAAVNGGADAIAYWTFTDFPDDYRADRSYCNRWGTFRWDAEFRRRYVYYAMGLLTRFGRGPASVHAVTAPEGVRGMALREEATGLYRVMLLSRRAEAIPIRLRRRSGDRWNVYVYNPVEADAYVAAGPLINANNTLAIGSDGEVVVPPQSMVVLVQR